MANNFLIFIFVTGALSTETCLGIDIVSMGSTVKNQDGSVHVKSVRPEVRFLAGAGDGSKEF